MSVLDVLLRSVEPMYDSAEIRLTVRGATKKWDDFNGKFGAHFESLTVYADTPEEAIAALLKRLAARGAKDIREVAA